MPQLTHIKVIIATLKVETGLRIGGGDEGMHIGGVDNVIIKHPHTNEPYLPGSSIKGKMRIFLECRSGAVQSQVHSKGDYDNAPENQKEAIKHILQLFGMGGSDKLTEKEAVFFGPSRLAFWDCSLNTACKESALSDGLPLTEVKSENRIDRIKGTAEHPRQTERIPAGAVFDFKLTFKVLSDDSNALEKTVLSGLKLLELDGLGGYGSRGYGKIRFENLKLNEEDIQEEFDQIKPFA